MRKKSDGPIKVGDRIGAIFEASNTEVGLIGYGVYLGAETPPVGTLGIGNDLHAIGMASAKLQMDDGTIVWGHECWWGPEPSVKRLCRKYKTRTVDFLAMRSVGELAAHPPGTLN